MGTVQDVRDLIADRLSPEESNQQPPPALARGWRADIVGNAIDDLLAGRLAIRITDPLSDRPLTLERHQQRPPN